MRNRDEWHECDECEAEVSGLWPMRGDGPPGPVIIHVCRDCRDMFFPHGWTPPVLEI